MIEDIVKVLMSPELKNSAEAIKAEAPPPNPLKIATIWGICVISTLIAKVAPMSAPIIMPTIIN